jgi:hypothetical protein
MQHAEDIRSTLITLAAIVCIGAYLKLISKAFSTGMLWGIISLVCPPFGGWIHAFTTWWDNSRIFIVHFVAGGVMLYALLFFPRVPVHGVWIDESGETVLRLDKDGTLRDLSLAPDGTFTLRGFKLLTREFPVPSVTRLAIKNKHDYHVGYYNPKTAVLMFYHEMKDPEVFFLGGDRHGYEFRRVVDPEAEAFKTKLARFAVRESAHDDALSLLAAMNGGPFAASLVDAATVQRYERYLALARTAPAGELEKLSGVDQVNVLRLRALYAPEIKAGTTVAALLAADAKHDYFMLRPFAGARVAHVVVNPAGQIATVIVATDGRDSISTNLKATRAANGRWGFQVLETRDRDIEQSVGRTNQPGKLTGALVYLRSSLGIPEKPQWSQPLQ